MRQLAEASSSLDEAGENLAITVVDVTVRYAQGGAPVDVPALLTSEGLILPVVEYCVAKHRVRSPAWLRQVLWAVRLFIGYWLANPNETDARRRFRNFANDIQVGTFDRNGFDPSWLCWSQTSPKRAAIVIDRLTSLFNWLEEQRFVSGALNPVYFSGSNYERLLDKAAQAYRKERAFLGHLWNENLPDEQAKNQRLVTTQDDVPTRTSNPPAFPEEHFMSLLINGHRIGEKPNYRDMAINTLIHGAGFRLSEVFHLYISDVIPNPNNPASAIVMIQHPQFGLAPPGRGGRKYVNREEYLWKEWGLRPRNLISGPYHAGWKGGLHEAEFGGKYFYAYWFEPVYGEMFLAIWYKYLMQIAHLNRNHPYAFVNVRREPKGDMYKISKFVDSHEAAMKRIGLSASKEDGTTPHGHRHAYGQRLVKAGIDELTRQRCLHHSDINSQKTYSSPSTSDVLRHLHAGMKNQKEKFDADGRYAELKNVIDIF